MNDIAIWDNRCTFHCATFDFMGLGDRSGNRAVGCGERPYFDPNSMSRSEAMEASGKEYGKWSVSLPPELRSDYKLTSHSNPGS